MNLSDVSLHKKAIITDIIDDEKVKNRLVSMGLEAGMKVSVINKTKIGKNIIIEFGEDYQYNRIMISGYEAGLVLVEYE